MGPDFLHRQFGHGDVEIGGLRKPAIQTEVVVQKDLIVVDDEDT